MELPLFVPGWEDSTLGNIFAARCLEGKFKPSTVRNGIEYMMELSQWYESNQNQLAFLQIGGGIAGDFPICVVPMLNQDLEREVRRRLVLTRELAEARGEIQKLREALASEQATNAELVQVGKENQEFILASKNAEIQKMRKESEYIYESLRS